MGVNVMCCAYVSGSQGLIASHDDPKSKSDTNSLPVVLAQVTHGATPTHSKT